jgi:hypothetical protein
MSRNKKAGAPVGAAGLLAAVVAVAVLVAPGTLSSFVSSTQTQGVSVSTGQAALTLSGEGGSGSGVYPGGPAQLIAARTLSNTGDVALGLAATFGATGALASSVVLTASVQTGVCAATPPAAPPADSGRWSGTAAGLTASAPTSIEAGASRTLCVWQSLDASAPNGTQGQTAAVTVSLTGTQVAP